MSGTVIGNDEGTLPYRLDFVLEAGAYAAGAAPLLLAAGVKRIVDDCVAQSLAHQNRRKAELREWQDLQRRQRAANAHAAALEETMIAAEQRLAALGLSDITKRAGAVPLENPEHRAAGVRMAHGASRLLPGEARVMLDEVGKLLDAAPDAFKGAPGNPWGQLDRQRRAMRQRLDLGEIPEETDILALREAFRRTLVAFLDAARIRRDWREALRTRIESALDTVLFAEHVIARFDAEMAVHSAELDTLRDRLTALCGAEEPDAAQLDLIERRLETLRGEIDRDTILAAQRRGAAEAITRILGQMGYEPIDDFAFERDVPLAVASLRIPGGEIVRAAMHRNRKVAFEVVHERAASADAEAPLSAEEHTHLRRQEQKWCADMREMFRRLVEEGFAYRVAFEQELREDLVKVVVVESAANVRDFDSEPDERSVAPRHMDN